MARQGLHFVLSATVAVSVCLLSVTVAEVELGAGTKIQNKYDPVLYNDCRELLKAGYNVSGVYRLHMNKTAPFFVNCEFLGGTAYTMIQRRQDYSVNFMQPMAVYMSGFGNVHGTFWLGLDAISHLTTSGSRTLTIMMQNYKGLNRNVHYSFFNVQPRPQRYQMTISGFTGYPLSDDLGHSTGMAFYTYDSPDPNQCAVNMKGGWWYNYCAYTMLNGYYYPPGPYTPSSQFFDGIFWQSFGGYNNSLKYVAMSLS